jgi:hypothetical protein
MEKLSLGNQAELKELMMHLAWNFTSQSNKVLLSTIRSTSEYLKLFGFLSYSFINSYLRFNPSSKFKIVSFGVDKANDTPFCALFSPITKDVGCTDSFAEGDFNLHKVR